VSNDLTRTSETKKTELKTASNDAQSTRMWGTLDCLLAGSKSTKTLAPSNLTGHGLKQPEAVHFTEKEFTPIAATLEALRELIKRVTK
jgi:hypothetical protein